ncbi:LysR substrate-binding domain-containing protein [Gellertiella hungarica]|uniref:LysR family glycine cleavage system transcriptional activator n=1 Tax=Gellertiella hungarica TaxID=1572859 RepID=A0A7W6NJE3_9HYPH|nr:LysR substrate-binding domain-containing protein [Gellertiella hungarica]MBB4063310.1 LysR family glycine cleavage system transcriptional activator [Gellertiella hungarica]
MTTPKQLPLNALRAFEATARLMSFTKAGEELGLTQAAVSYQIRLLEEQLGRPLFVRKPRQIALTPAGERLLPEVSEAFTMLRKAIGSFTRDDDGTIVLTATPTFTAQWLTRHLVSFHQRNPGMALQLFSTHRMCYFDSDPIDIAIRVGDGNWPGLEAHKLFQTDFTPMLSPALLAKAGPLDHPADLLRLPILDPRDPWWLHWFREAGVPEPDLKDQPPNQFGAQMLEANAAMAGQGVAILTPGFYRAEIAAGLLVTPFPQLSSDRSAHWLAYPKARAGARKIRLFRDWILSEVARDFT